MEVKSARLSGESWIIDATIESRSYSFAIDRADINGVLMKNVGASGAHEVESYLGADPNFESAARSCVQGSGSTPGYPSIRMERK